jgi:glucose-6-phosphate 1-dehydrogenase
MTNTKTILPNTIIFIFGGSGDLSQRKLIPALFNLYLDELMPTNFSIVCFGRKPLEDVDLKKLFVAGIKKYSRKKYDAPIAKQWKKFSTAIEYFAFDVANKKSYGVIAQQIKSKEKDWKATPHCMFYLAVAPQLVEPIATNLSKIDYCINCEKSRIVIEKPFGHDLQSAKDLNALLKSIFKEKQIYRIDHYLGKETVQNILALRFANTLLEPVWNKNFIDHIQITNAESIGIEGRGEYYERSGVLRDMVQNHILQLVCMIAMEAPLSFDANEIRNKKVDVLNAIRKINGEDVPNMSVRGQYSSGWIESKKVKGYREEENVNPNSNVETFAALKLYVDNWRWEGVPFYIRSGKYLKEKNTSITIHFKRTPNFSFPPEAAETWRSNVLTISIQPQMDIALRFQAKRPGPNMILNPVNMVFSYASYNMPQPEAYETLLYDVMEGDASLFMRDDQVEAAWKIITPILESWQVKTPTDFPNYTPGSWGPELSEALIAKDGHTWINQSMHNTFKND